MKILFDQGVPVPLRRYLSDHSVDTAYERGWSRLSNGDLLDAAEQAGFELLVTTDQNLRYQQNLTHRKLAIVVLSKGRWRLIKERLPEIAAAVAVASPGTVTEVQIPDD